MFNTPTPQVRVVLDAIRSGSILLPEFQRGFVWDAKKKVLPFLDSLYRRYPTGGLLLWRTRKPPLVRGGDQAEGEWVELLLDGQQRMTVLYAVRYGQRPAFYDPETSKPLPTEWYFDPTDEEFTFRDEEGSGPAEDGPEWFSVKWILEKGNKLWALANLPDNPLGLTSEQRDIINAHTSEIQGILGILDYEYYARYLDEEQDGRYKIDQVVEIFDRVNTGGERLDVADILIAHMCTYWPDVRRELIAARHELDRMGFAIDIDVIARCVSATATASGMIRAAWESPQEAIRDAWEPTKRASENIVNLLPHWAYIAGTDDLPSQAPLIVLTAHVADRPRQKLADGDEIKVMMAWLLLALARGRYSGQAERTLDDDLLPLRDARRADQDWGAHVVAGRLLRNLWRQRGHLWATPRELAGYTPAARIFRLVYIAARARQAIDWCTGMPIYSQLAGSHNRLDRHHIFPRNYLRKHGYDVGGSTEPDHKRMANEIANLALLTQGSNLEIRDEGPAEYLPEIEKKFPGALASQFVPMDEGLWTAERFPDFLAERRNLIAEAINDMLDDMAGEVISDIEPRPS